MPIAEIRDTRIHYETLGERGPPILLIMGLRSRGIAWHDVAERLSERHRVCWWDHRGIGESDPLDGPTSMGEMAADAAGMIEHLGWDTAHVAGVSMGGMVAQHVALNHGERVRSLSLVVTSAKAPPVRDFAPSTLGIYLRTMAGPRRKRLAALARLLHSAMHLQRLDIDAVMERLARAFGHDQPGTMRRQVAAIRGHDCRERLDELSELPTLVVGAGRDRLVSIRHSEYLHARLPRSRLVRVETSGHAVIGEEPDIVSSAITGVVARGERVGRTPATAAR